MADPGEPLDVPAIGARLKAALEGAHRSRQIDVAWFGMGDHPQFDVGLHDLHAFAPALASLRRAGWQPKLRVLTNPPRPDGQRAGAARAGCRCRGRWMNGAPKVRRSCWPGAWWPSSRSTHSPSAPRSRSTAPWTALSAGVQVLSAGLPLYDRLQPLIYRDPVELVDHLQQRRLRLREQTVPDLAAHLLQQADASHEAAGLAGFLKQLRRRPAGGKAVPTLALLHGVRSEKAVHEMAQRARQLSVGGPYANPGLNYDLRLVSDAGGLQVQLGDAALPLLRPELQRALVAATSPTGRRGEGHRLPPAWPRRPPLCSRAH